MIFSKQPIFKEYYSVGEPAPLVKGCVVYWGYVDDMGVENDTQKCVII